MAKPRKVAALLASGLLLALAGLFHLLGWEVARSAALLLASAISGWSIAVRAVRSLLIRVFSIELLVTIAMIGAIILGEYVEAAAVAFLFRLGAYLEAITLSKTRSALKALIDMAPAEAIVLRDGVQVKVLASEVVRGDRVLLSSGSKIAVDGQVASGQALVNEAAITGEPVPVAKQVHDRVFSGTTVDTGYLEVIAEQVGEDTTFAKIIELVEEAQESKAKTQKFLDKFASYYTPGMLLLAVLVFIVSRNPELALTFLVIACPGALVISVPVSMVAGLGNGAANGLLIKGGEVLENLARAEVVVFDKTGTLTEGRPTVVSVHTYGGVQERELLELTAALEAASEHPLGQAIVNAAKARNVEPAGRPKQVEVHKGCGIRGEVRGRTVRVGKREWLEQQGVAISKDVWGEAERQEKRGYTVVFAAADGMLIGVIAIADPVRAEAQEAIQGLKRKGVKRVVMLTGDNRHAAQQVADRLGIDQVHAGLLPADKVALIQEWQRQGRRVTMLGDGINDAPAIAAADIGLAMGGAGTDIAIETADAVIMADRLDKLVYARQLAKRTVRNMKQNVSFAITVVVLLLAGVLTRHIYLASGMFIHEFSVILVILNALRLTWRGRGTRTNRNMRRNVDPKAMITTVSTAPGYPPDRGVS
ncbi:cadmium-exporting ATPase [Paenibacillus sp. oral taxon 786 str. D14]|uniref:heavy metal translocating P-type ATPase n=1 Tax=Paenibacillus sp. oral taxon 786 TaxID=652715 RepID=UPI0001AFD3E2|nr:cation-translocating P-type ATPase [Paenibacillus sp. oral taxon 786]EES74441.1 cadmium-exporting ATPase [Paenibacillus sp. oral taxon 786 str. D14]